MSTDTTPPALTDEISTPPSEESANAATSRPVERSSFSFDSMKLKIGDRMQVQPPAKLSAERCTTRLIGYVHGASLIVTTPQAGDGMRLQLLEGEQLVIRFFSSQNAFGFSCEVQRVCKIPYPYLHLSFPARVQGTVIRKASRVKTKIIAQVVTKIQRDDTIPVVITNMSTHGLQLDAEPQLAEKGELLKLMFRLNLHGVDTQLSVTAKVRSVFMEESSSTRANYGLEFVDLSPNDHMFLKSMVYEQIIDHPQKLI